MFGSTTGKGFRGTLDYALDINGRHDKDARILDAEGVDVFYNAEGHLDADPVQLGRSFRAQAMMDPGVKKCVRFLWQSYKEEDILIMVNNAFKAKEHYNSMEEAIKTIGEERVKTITDEAMVSDAKRLLKELHYDNTQYVIVRHSEKNNPHVHIILNMVNNEGKRLEDFQEKKRGIKICRQITLDNNYTWGDHKSISMADINNPKQKARAEICKTIHEITLGRFCDTAAKIQMEAYLRGINVKFVTKYDTGEITGLSFEKDGFIFPANKVDVSLSTRKLFPAQVKAKKSLSELPEEEQELVKDGGIVPGFNNQTLSMAQVPRVPMKVKQQRRRDDYHHAIAKAEKDGSRTAYLHNISGLALDEYCGTPEERAEAAAPYIVDETTDNTVEVHCLLDIIQSEEQTVSERKSVFDRFTDFLQKLMDASLNLKKYSITTVEDGRLHWSNFVEGIQGMTVWLGREIYKAINEAFSEENQKLTTTQTRPESHTINIQNNNNNNLKITK